MNFYSTKISYKSRHGKVSCAILFMLFFAINTFAQFNTDRVMIMGRSALYYEDYVLSIQRFSLVISAKPHLAEPYFFRGLAKFYLEDFNGAEGDVSNAIQRNPYTENYYVLRGLCRVNTSKYAQAEEDYRKAIDINPDNADYWHNMVLCQVELKEYDRADSCLDVMIGKWPKTSNNYSIKAQVALAKTDTVGAETWIDKAIEVNAFDGQAWSVKALMLLKRNEYAKGEEALDKAILQSPRQPDLYINRALARYNQDNLRGAMNDYDAALELNNNSYVGHFNRALLRAQVGDDNRAIEDFNFVIEHEPDNYVAIYNRALLLNNTGDYKGAIQDITVILQEYPNFWDGYSLRASIRRKLGDTNGAERDEFKVLKARMEGTLAGKKKSTNKTRKESDQNLEDYNKLVVADEEEFHEQYANEYRGKVQDRDAEAKPERSYVLSYYSTESMGHATGTYHSLVEQFNKSEGLLGKICLTNSEGKMAAEETEKYFADINKQTLHIDQANGNVSLCTQALMMRALDYYFVRDFESAILDLDVILSDDKLNVLALFLRAQMRTALYANTEDLTQEIRLELHKIADDLKQAYSLDHDLLCALYNQGNAYFSLHEYEKAEDIYTQVIAEDPQFAEAYYNRGLARILLGKTENALADLSQAGEFGLYTAYNLIKKYSKK